ncbi:MAG: 4-hydroxy-tetrahydrodipicolinate synthase [Verrucomicrobiota bacterium]|nr:4-hydroxy-tetrahydrodipicolinate synthase [Verrucomicrobiota bacterium]
MNIQGCYTALVTPFKNGEIDWKTLDILLNKQIEAKVNGIVPMGTTGESPTVSTKEHSKIIERTIEKVEGISQVIAGTGANSTEEALELTSEAKKAGADASLQVTPYYNKPTAEGLYRHFSTIADKAGLPIILYNVPGRSGIPIPIDTIVKLAENPNIVAVKEAGGSVDRVSEILSRCDITVLSGDDPLTLPMMSVGASGVISVASNILPAEITELTSEALKGNFSQARKIHYRLYKLFQDIFIETNPLPVKTALAMMGLIEEEFRLPLCEMQEANKKQLKQTLVELGNCGIKELQNCFSN